MVNHLTALSLAFSFLFSILAMREPNWMARLGSRAVFARPKRWAKARRMSLSPRPLGWSRFILVSNGRLAWKADCKGFHQSEMVCSQLPNNWRLSHRGKENDLLRHDQTQCDYLGRDFALKWRPFGAAPQAEGFLGHRAQTRLCVSNILPIARLSPFRVK